MLEKEAFIFTRYLVRQSPSDELAERYASACSKLKLSGSPRDEKILSLALRRPGLLPLLDAGLAFGGPATLLRRKLLVMLAILETTPEHYGLFATRNESRLRWAGLFFKGCFAVLKMITGKFILIFI